MRNLLITGGTTFVSKTVANYFSEKGDRVYVLNRGSRPQVDGVTLICRDRAEPGDELKHLRFDAVLDICAYTGEHVERLLDALGEFGDYILLSSSAVYPETNPQPFSERQPVGMNRVWGDYGTNKIDAENALTRRVPNAYILRPPYLYGVNENLYREGFVFDCAMQDRPFFIRGEGEMRLQFFNVSDLCLLMDTILQKHPKERLLNVGNPESVSVREWVTICYKAAGKKAEFISVADNIPLRNYFPFHDYEYRLEVSRMRDILPNTIPLADGLEEEFEWYRRHPESVYVRKPYWDYIDNCLCEKDA